MIKLPNECFFKVFNNLQDDSKSLYSCLLVNRLWCRIVVPILWSNIAKKLNNRKLINTCLLALNEEEKALLSHFEILLPNHPKPLFDYTSYATSVGSSLNAGIIKWLNYNGHKEIQFRWESYKDNLVNAVKCSLIASFLRTNKRLEYLEIFGFIDNDNKIIKNLSGNNSIISLYLHNNWCDSEGVAEILCKNTTLSHLILNNNNVSIRGVKTLANAIHKNTTLDSLSLIYDNIGSEEGKVLAAALYINTTLTSLDLSYNNIGVEGGKALAEVLCKNTTLTSLNLSSNNIGNEGGGAFAEALYINTTLSSLDLSCNYIDVEGGKALAKALCKNTALTSLNLSGNKICIEGRKAFSESVCINNTLTSLDLSHN